MGVLFLKIVVIKQNCICHIKVGYFFFYKLYPFGMCGHGFLQLRIVRSSQRCLSLYSHSSGIHLNNLIRKVTRYIPVSPHAFSTFRLVSNFPVLSSLYVPSSSTHFSVTYNKLEIPFMGRSWYSQHPSITPHFCFLYL